MSRTMKPIRPKTELKTSNSNMNMTKRSAPSRVLVNVNVERGLGPVHLVVPLETTVTDLVKTVVDVYVKEKRRPLLKETDPLLFQLHYSQFSLESLKPEEKLMDLGSRNFFMCSRPSTKGANSSCSEETNMTKNKSIFPPAGFTGLLL